MKRLVVILGILAAFCASWPAAAQPQERRIQPPSGKDMPPPGRAMPAQRMPGREDSDARQTRGRMTPEERQQLRRDINDHGREIYREAPKNPRP